MPDPDARNLMEKSGIRKIYEQNANDGKTYRIRYGWNIVSKTLKTFCHNFHTNIKFEKKYWYHPKNFKI